MLVIGCCPWSTQHINAGCEDFLQRLLFNGNCLEYEEKEKRKNFTTAGFTERISAVLKVLSQVFTQFIIMPPEGEVVRENEPLFTRNGVITGQRTRGKGKAEAKYMAGLQKEELLC